MWIFIIIGVVLISFMDKKEQEKEIDEVGKARLKRKLAHSRRNHENIN